MKTQTEQRVLRLTLKKKWFEMVASGQKKEEYREEKDWILSRLKGKEYDVVEFSNGYGKNVPKVAVEYMGWKYGTGYETWGASYGEVYIIIDLGKVIKISNKSKS